MAKVRAPLYSAAAVGSIGQCLYFSTHHGVNVVGKKPTPTNPNTPEQVDERLAMAAAAAEWQAMGLTSLDMAAWNALATLRKAKYNGYNLFVKMFIEAYNSGRSWVRFWNMRNVEVGRSTIEFDVEVMGWSIPLWAVRTGHGVTGPMYIELTPVGGQTWHGRFYDLTWNHKYHFWVYNSREVDRYGQSGAYYAHTKYH